MKCFIIQSKMLVSLHFHWNTLILEYKILQQKTRLILLESYNPYTLFCIRLIRACNVYIDIIRIQEDKMFPENIFKMTNFR